MYTVSFQNLSGQLRVGVEGRLNNPSDIEKQFKSSVFREADPALSNTSDYPVAELVS